MFVPQFLKKENMKKNGIYIKVRGKVGRDAMKPEWIDEVGFKLKYTSPEVNVHNFNITFDDIFSQDDCKKKEVYC